MRSAAAQPGLGRALGQFTNALEVFERDAKNQAPLTIAYDEVFEAMCYQRLGKTAKAETVFAKATKWLEENPGQVDAELKEFRAEAETLLGKQKK
jgi:tetratricopeptide (TPR) repeat protein